MNIAEPKMKTTLTHSAIEQGNYGLKGFSLLATMMLILFSDQVYAQQSFFFHRIDYAAHGGFIAPHQSTMRHLTKGHFVMQHLSLSGKARGQFAWHQVYNFPEMGLNFLYTRLAYPDVLGEAYSLFPHVLLRITGNDRFGLYARHGLGIAYLTKVFDLNDNFRNNAIGSHFNIALNMSVESRWNFHSGWTVITGMSLTHFSNGRVQTPNKGINIPGFKLALAWDFIPQAAAIKEFPELPHERKPTVIFMATSGTSASYPPGSAFNRRMSLNTTANFPLGKKVRLGAGYDFFRSEHKIKIPGEFDQTGFFSLHGLHLAFQQDFSRMAFVIQKGVYVYDKRDFSENRYYHRAGFRYNVYRNFLLNLTLKTHFFKAETIEWGLGYML